MQTIMLPYVWVNQPNHQFLLIKLFHNSSKFSLSNFVPYGSLPTTKLSQHTNLLRFSYTSHLQLCLRTHSRYIAKSFLHVFTIANTSSEPYSIKRYATVTRDRHKNSSHLIESEDCE